MFFFLVILEPVTFFRTSGNKIRGESNLFCSVGPHGIIMSFNPGQALERGIVSPELSTDGNLLVEAVSCNLIGEAVSCAKSA